ncbi:unnamed protein product [Brachionus calyciflorus]|uniref:C3H1-type domain-containing protein n=1 Tax=Brachionus calyciflorus TaxID=104777 RepID=A0A813MLF5_9BILA|nr:unnamed protein product [Brachionus calyciflorus]
MPLLSLADFDKSLKLNQLLYNQLNPLLNNNLLNAQLNLLTAEQLLQNVSTSGHSKQTSYSRYKTELCRQFSENGQCKYGDKCQFAHGVDELKDVRRHPKYKTDFCKTFHSKGFCPYGPRCHFIHELNENLELANGLPSVNKTKKLENSINNTNTNSSTNNINNNNNNLNIDGFSSSQLANSLLLNIKSELVDSGSESKKFDCQEERNLFVNNETFDKSLNRQCVSLNASPSSTTSSNSSLNDLFTRQVILSPKMEDSPQIRTRSSVSSTSSCFSTTSSTNSINPFDLYQQSSHKLFNLISLATNNQNQKSNFTQQIIW